MWRSKEDAVRDFMKLNNNKKENEAIINEALSYMTSDENKEEFNDYGKFIDTRTGETIDISSSDSENKEDFKGWGRGMIIKRFKDIGISRMQIQMVQKIGVGNHMIERYFAKCNNRELEKNTKTADQHESKEELKYQEKKEIKNPISHVKAARKSDTKNVIVSKFLSSSNNEDDDKNMCAASVSSVIPKSKTTDLNSSETDLIENSYINDAKNTSQKDSSVICDSRVSKSDKEQGTKYSGDENDTTVATTTYDKNSKSNDALNKSYYSLVSEFHLNHRKKEKEMKSTLPKGKCNKFQYSKKKKNTDFKYHPDSFPPL